ncbi:MAG: Peptidyl-tRNA hydrolase [Deltaproteobacteria bacterium ADurb.Bin026]|nr:MAG: Peptidyl-tRNA hydrolase [Deltaproteobacteria bacterium ADurb.Bin026]
MFLLCGLGNKGFEYSYTRHNIGYLVVDRYSERFKIPLTKNRCGCKTGINDNIVLAKPDTYMNLSGTPVSLLMRKMNISPDDFILIHDDLDMDFGRIKIKWNGGHGGHKGVSSVVDALQTNLFHRLKIGIGRSPFMTPEDYVLSRFQQDDAETLNESIDIAVEALHVFVYEGKAKAMSMYNRG